MTPLRRRLLGVASLVAGALLVVCLWRRGPSPSAVGIEGDAAVAVVDAAPTRAEATTIDSAPEADAAIAIDDLDHDPPRGTCRAKVGTDTPLGRVPDRVLAAAVVARFDGDAGGEWSVRDCVGHRLAFGPPSDDQGASTRIAATLVSLMSTGEEDGGAAAGPYRVARGPVLGRKMAINVTVGIARGYDDTCYGFLALVRLDDGEVIVEAVTVASGCESASLAHLDGKLVLVEPTPPSNTGESAATVDGSYRILQPREGVLASLGMIPAYLSWGNGALNQQGPFVSFDSKLVAPEGPTLELEEQWRSEHLDDPDHEAHALHARVVRSYSRDGGALVPDPRGAPAFGVKGRPASAP